MRIERRAADTIIGVELDVGDELALRQTDGQLRQIAVSDAQARVTRRGAASDGCIQDSVLRYTIACTLTIDGVQVQLVRNIPAQENFRPPPRVMGLRIWLDAVEDLFAFLDERPSDRSARPGRRVRLALWEDRSRICPVLLHPWIPLPHDGLRVEECYEGQDTWLGPYGGRSVHAGLDLNHPAGTPLWAPINIDEHRLYERSDPDTGYRLQCWEGLHHWPNGTTWLMETYHVIRLLVAEGAPIAAGTHYAEAAGNGPGLTEHSHFVFAIRDHDGEILLDPWLLFWQMYEDRKATTRVW